MLDILKDKTIWFCCVIIAICLSVCIVWFPRKEIVVNDNSHLINKLEEEKKEAFNRVKEIEIKYKEVDLKLIQKTVDNKSLAKTVEILKQELNNIEVLDEQTNPFIVKQAEIIIAQDNEIKGLKEEIVIINNKNELLLSSNNELKKVIEKCELQRNLDKISKEAYTEALKASRQKGRLEGGSAIAILDLGLRLLL